ncbi:Arylsulfatase [Polystyrenella longa]|uniref:Arylsulfatase n=1 Tax=Polystyrenella longa TaxID=2528007 RepID=A0A518CLT7_9PLAN|nr:arylsulfatase [Polystyrenella longa]QDU80185.1 Arylsulfatase [Polystyrenella longa]
MRLCLKTVLLVLGMLTVFISPAILWAAPQENLPNVVILLADDQGWGDLSLHGNTNLSTPHIDSLANEGAQFDHFFVCPVCAPTRAEFMTGRYYARTGVRGVSTGEERMNPNELTIADVFQTAGYATGAFGKWHNGTQFPYHPNARGFEEYFGFTAGHWGHYFSPLLDHNNQLTLGEGYLTDDLTNHAIDFISTQYAADKPFLCYLPFNIPHSPMQVPDKFYDQVKNRELKMHHRDPEKEEELHLRAALAMCENIDFNVGRLLAHLDQLNLAEDTIIVYFSDNGPNGWRWNGDMKGKKGTIDEGGVRVPCLIRWKGTIPAGTVIKPIAGAIDLLPTITSLAGISFDLKYPIDGKNLAPLLLGEKEDEVNRKIISYHPPRERRGKIVGPLVSVRSQQYRLDSQGQLFDMFQDPGQRNDVASAHPDIVNELQKSSNEFLASLGEIPTSDTRPFSVGGAKITQLPARDGVAHGEVQRSAGAPNCSYFTHWTGAEGDKITWHVDVLDDAEYEVQIHYACRAKDVGASFEVRFQDSHLQGKVTEPNDPPLVGKEQDRTNDRGSESYVKDWKPMTVGTIHLEKGAGQLTLKELNVPGDEVMEVRLIQLIKQ